MLKRLDSSKRELYRTFYNIINQIARPGDVVFFISEPRNKRHFLGSRLYRKWQGLDDKTAWHTAVLVDPKKESKGAHWLPRIIHAIRKGVEEIYLPRSYFTSVREDPEGVSIQNARIEILQHRELTNSQRSDIVDYVRTQLGKPFANLGWRHDFLTYAFGLSPGRIDHRKVSCHGLAFAAYKKVGFSFPHQLKSTPFFNLAKYLGHPIGHPPDEVDINRLYLRDHHLYRDTRFESVLAIFEDEDTKEIKVIHNPGKNY